MNPSQPTVEKYERMGTFVAGLVAAATIGGFVVAAGYELKEHVLDPLEHAFDPGQRQNLTELPDQGDAQNPLG